MHRMNVLTKDIPPLPPVPVKVKQKLITMRMVTKLLPT